MRNKKLLYIIIGVAAAIVIALAITLPLVLTGNSDAGGSAACKHADMITVVTSAPTCTEEGKQNKICNICGKVVETQTIDAIGHAYGIEWELAVDPTLTANGERIKVCGNDGSHVLSESVPKLSTENVYTVSTVDASCARVGKTVYSSQEYGDITVYTPKLAHDYSTASVNGRCGVCNNKISSLNLSFTLTADGKGYSVGKSSSYTDVDLVILAEYKGLPVTEIASEAFAEWRWITSVTIPESVVKIGAGAFSQMSGITKVRFDAVDCSDLDGRNWAFFPAVDGSSKPIELTVGSAVQKIPARLFFPLATEPTTNATLAKITFEEGCAVKSIGDYAFYRTAVTECELPRSLERIGDYAFYGTQLESVTMRENLTEIGDGAFGACENLKSVELGRNIESIGDDCFNYCVKLQKVNLAVSSVEALGDDAFKNCYRLERVYFPSTLVTVGNAAFYGCAALTDAALVGELEAIGDSAFYGCTALKSLTLPKKLKSIGASAFENCSSLDRIIYLSESCNDLVAGNRAFAAAGEATDGVNVVIGATVKRIPSRLFFSSAEVEANMYIVSLEICDGVETIGDYAFYGAVIDVAVYNGSAAQWTAVEVGNHNAALAHVTAIGE